MRRFKATLSLSFHKNIGFRLGALGVGAALGLVSLIALRAPLGSLLAAALTGFVSLILTVTAYAEDYGASVKHGTSRKTALAAVTVESLGMPLAMLALTLVMEQVEWLYVAGRLTEGTLLRRLPLVLAAYIGLWLMGMLGGWCIRKFGHSGVTVVYFAYLFLLVLGPQLFEKLVERVPALGELAARLTASPTTLAAAALAAAAALSFALYKCDV